MYFTFVSSLPINRRDEPANRLLDVAFSGTETRIEPERVDPAERDVVLACRVTYLDEELPMVAFWILDMSADRDHPPGPPATRHGAKFSRLYPARPSLPAPAPLTPHTSSLTRTSIIHQNEHGDQKMQKTAEDVTSYPMASRVHW